MFTRVEATRPQPLIDLRVLGERAVAATNLTGFLVGFAMFASFLLIPQFAQAPESSGYGFGATVTESGLLLLPAALAQLIAGPLAGRLGSRIGFRTTLVDGRRLRHDRVRRARARARRTRGSSRSPACCWAPASRSRSPRWRT